jgi:chromosome partitioning protein
MVLYCTDDMAIHILALCNLKGGTAKTTSAVYLSTCLHARGEQVTLLDADNEQSALNWASDGGLPFPVAVADIDRLGRQARQLEGYVVIDTPPNNREALLTAALAADTVLVPVAPTAQDVNRLEPTLDLLTQVEERLDKDMTSILLVRYDKRRVLAREFLDVFADYPVLENKISNRVAYQSVLGETPTYLLEYDAVLSEVL